MDPNQNIQNLLTSYGFTFAGNDESGQPVFTAPNGQIVTAKVAIDFVHQQEKLRQQQSGGNSVEAMPQMTSGGSMERGVESRMEQETSIEKQEEKKEEQQNQQQLQTVQQPVAQQTPQVAAAPKVMPFGEGFTPKKFDASSLTQTKDFVASNISSSNSNSNKWMAIQFQKFIEQYEDSIKT